MYAWLVPCYTTLCDPVDCRSPGSIVHEILQAKILEWIAMPSFGGSSRPKDRTCVSYISCTGPRVLFVCLFVFTTNATWEAWNLVMYFTGICVAAIQHTANFSGSLRNACPLQRKDLKKHQEEERIRTHPRRPPSSVIISAPLGKTNHPNNG